MKPSEMLRDVHIAFESGFVWFEMLSVTPPLLKLRFGNCECTVLVRPALIASLRGKTNIVVTSSVCLVRDGEEILIVLGVRDAIPSDQLGVMVKPDETRVEVCDLPLMHAPTPIAELCTRRGSRPDIKCFIASKGDPISFKNGSGELIAFVLEDASGKIRAVSFSPDCHSIDARLRVGGCYRITGGRCKKSDSRFNEVDHEYELVLDASALIAEV